MRKENKNKPKLNLLALMLVLMAVMLGMVIVSATGLKRAGNTLQNMEKIWSDLHLCEVESRSLREASDYLTNEVRRFVLSSDTKDLDAYWNEINVLKRREQAVSSLREMNLTEEEQQLVQDAKQESDNLMQSELHAMRLVAENLSPSENLPEEIGEASLSGAELALTDRERIKAALDIVFGEAYTESKEVINGKLNEFSSLLVERKQGEVQAVHEETRKILRAEHFLNVSFCVLFIVYIILYYRKVIVPLRKYNEGIERIAAGGADALPVTGPAEMRRFGENFNKVFREWQEQNRKLEELSRIDFLTKLPNRAALEERMDAICMKEPSSFALLKIDVDALRRFNDEYGHLTGDKILILVSRAVTEAVGHRGMTVRLSGEEFLAVLENITDSEVQGVCDAILDSVHHVDCSEAGIPNNSAYVTASIGGTLWRRGTGTELSLNTLLYQAELALMFSKKNGKNRSTMYQRTDSSFTRLDEEMKESRALMEDMYRALEQHEFIPYYQPQYDFKTGEMIGAEALVRWQHPGKGMIPPGVFIPEFEKNGLVKELDMEMLRQVCESLRSWREQGLNPPSICCNFSRRHFDGDEEVAGRISGMAKEYGVPVSLLTVEITESALDEDAGNLKEELTRISELGTQIALDDFGVGYSSLGILTEFPINFLKIDKSFLDRDLQDRKNLELLKGVLNIAKALNLKTICEGVETKEQAELLKSLGCMYAQGYYYSRPVPAADFQAMMAGEKNKTEIR
ncbi:MAG: EAL domain-containing protein [Eubacteriales bacterium]|nr:EAL domain-containing protein [Eubacteriales bacterium]